MSSWVWKHSKSKGTSKLVLLKIADHAADDGSNAWPAIETIVKETGLSRSSVHSIIKKLVELKELEVEPNAGGPLDRRADRRTNRYRVVMNGVQNLTLVAGRGPESASTGSRNQSLRGPGSVPEPSLEPSLEPSAAFLLVEQKPSRAVDVTVETELDARFEEIWKSYPRKDDKREAFATFKARVKQGISFDELRTAVLRYAAERKNQDPKFTLLGKTFFGPNEKWKRYLPSGDPEADCQNVRHYDENGDEYTDSEWAAVSSGAFLQTEEAKKWRVEADDPRWLEHLEQMAQK